MNFTFDSNMMEPQASERTVSAVPVSSSDMATLFAPSMRPTAGVEINERNALSLSAFWCGVRLISETIAIMSCKLFRRRADGGREPAGEKHPVSRMLFRRPNPWTSWFRFISTLQSHALCWGNAYAEIEFNQKDEPIALWQVTPNRVKPEIANGIKGIADGELVYRVDGTKIVPAWKMLHIPGLGFDGLQGYGVTKMARESLSAVAGLEQHGAAFFGNSALPSGLLKFKGKIAPEARKTLREEWKAIYGGQGSGGVAVLQDGAEFSPMTMSNEDSQFLESRQWSVVVQAQWLNIPPTFLMDFSRATFSNIEETGRNLLTFTMLPWTEVWSQELDCKMLSEDEKDDHYFAFTHDKLLMANQAARYTAYGQARQWGFMSINDIRRYEDMPPIGPEGDIYQTPANMVPAGTEPQKVEPTQVAPFKKQDNNLLIDGKPIKFSLGESA